MSLAALQSDVSACRLCADRFAATETKHAPRPVVWFEGSARILIAGQAPGARVHASGIPFDDASGERLREWMGLQRDVFYDAGRIAILPMGFCYPGQGPSGDLPPRPECAATWRRPLLEAMPKIEFTLVLGAYAQRYHLGPGAGSLTERVRGWRQFWPAMVPLPHPSPRNNRWLKLNPWFGEELLPALKTRIGQILDEVQE